MSINSLCKRVAVMGKLNIFRISRHRVGWYNALLLLPFLNECSSCSGSSIGVHVLLAYVLLRSCSRWRSRRHLLSQVSFSQCISHLLELKFKVTDFDILFGYGALQIVILLTKLSKTLLKASGSTWSHSRNLQICFQSPWVTYLVGRHGSRGSLGVNCCWLRRDRGFFRSGCHKFLLSFGLETVFQADELGVSVFATEPFISGQTGLVTNSWGINIGLEGIGLTTFANGRLVVISTTATHPIES